MLAWPDKTIQLHWRREEDHENDLQLVSDWLEGQILFGEEEGVVLSEVVDIMLEKQVSDDDKQCWVFIEDAFNRLKQRHGVIESTTPIAFNDGSALLKSERSHTALRFCTMLALGELFKHMREVVFVPHSDRGYLFERLAENALTSLFPRWKTVRTGWTPEKPANITSLVQTMTGSLNELAGNHEHWSPLDAKDEGLDLYCYYPFDDIHSGYPVYLIQCATGINWRGKIAKPSLRGWEKYIQFTCSPRKGFIIPFALKDFWVHGKEIEGPLLDRYRLLSFDTPENEWLSPDLANELESWLIPRIASLQALGR